MLNAEAMKKGESRISKERSARSLTRKSLERMRLPSRYWTAKYSQISEGEHKVVVGRYLVGLPSLLRRGIGMVLSGDNGVGKTSIAAVCLKNARKHGATGLFLTAHDYLSGVMNRVRFDDSCTCEERAKAVDFLVLDELGKEPIVAANERDGFAAMIEDLVRTRVNNLRCTVITTNVDKDALELRYGKSFIALMKGTVSYVVVTGVSHRDRELEQLKEYFETDKGDRDEKKV